MCPVVIDSLQPERCPVASVLPPTDQSAVPTADPSPNPATDSPTDVTVIVIVVAVAVVVLLVMVTAIVAIAIVVIIFCRKQSKYRYVPICHINTPYISSWIAFKVCILWWNKVTNYLYSTSHHFLLCRPNSSPANSVYEDESMNKGDLARADMTKNPSYAVTRDVVSTKHALGTEEEDDVDHTYEVLPFEVDEEWQEDTKRGAQKSTTVDVH